MKFIKIFVLIFTLFFIILRTLDNESICGEVGMEEKNCFFNFISEESDTSHICINCPCNTLISSNVPLKVLILINISKIEILSPGENYTYNYIIYTFLFRPPKLNIIYS